MTKVQITDLASFFVLHCNSNEIEINHFKLQKLLYYSQAWHFVYFDKNSLFDDLPEAWVNGPVYRTVYDQWRYIYAATGIKIDATHIDELRERCYVAYKKLGLDSAQEHFINSLLEHYGLMSHEKLIYMTHQEDPWKIARSGLGAFDRSNTPISLDSMYDYYSKLA